eukprot:CFRG0190T1
MPRAYIDELAYNKTIKKSETWSRGSLLSDGYVSDAGYVGDESDEEAFPEASNLPPAHPAHNPKQVVVEPKLIEFESERESLTVDNTAAFDHHHGPRVGQRPEKVLTLSKQGPKERYGLVVFRTSNTLFVLCAYEDTLASAVGLRFGDEILAVNGKTSVDMTGAMAAKEMLSSTTCTLKVRPQPLAVENRIKRARCKAQMGIKLEDNRIERVRKDHLAAKAGLKTGNVIITVDRMNCIGETKETVYQMLQGGGIVETMAPEVYHSLTRKFNTDTILRHAWNRYQPV